MNFNWPYAGCRGLWHLDGNGNDSSGNGNNGTNAGGVAWGLGRFGQAGVFDGSSTDYISIAQAASLQPTDFSISLWYKGTDKSGCRLFSNFCYAIRSELYHFGFDTWINATGTPGFGVYNGGYTGYSSLLSGNTTIADDIWHWIVWTRDDDWMRIYVDGRLDASLADPKTPAYALQNPPVVTIGGRQYFTSYTLYYRFYPTGKIDEVMLLGYVLSERDVRRAYAFQTGKL